MTLIDPDEIQKFLSLHAPLITDQLTGTLAPVVGNGITLLEPANTQRVVGKDTATCIIQQGQMLSSGIISNPAQAKEVFGDLPPGVTKDNSYSVVQEIIYEHNNDRYAFNIEELNDNLDWNRGKFFFKSLDVNNKSKDIFTTKLNYHVVFKIGFNFFEDLIADVIPMRCISDPSKGHITKSLLSILYRNLNRVTVGTPVSLTSLNNRDREGLILQQTLILNTNLFPETERQFGQICKNHHLTYYRHEFNVFKNNTAEPIGAIGNFENELTIEFFSYETDISNRAAASPKTGDITTTDNLFSVLANKQRFDKNGVNTGTYEAYAKRIETLAEEIKKRTFEIECAYKRNGTTSDTVINDPITNTQRSIEDILADIENSRQEITSIKLELGLALSRQLEANCNRYVLTVKQFYLNKFTDRNFWRDWITSGGLAGVAGLTLLGTLGAFGIGTGGATGAAGAAAALGLSGPLGWAILIAGIAGAGYTAYSAFGEEIESLNIDSSALSSLAASQIKIQKDPVNRLSFFGDPGTPQVISAQAAADAIKGDKDEIKKFLNPAGTEIGENADDDVEIRFILFGDIIKNLNILNPELKIVIGGKLIPIDNTTCRFLNFYKYPISLAAFRQFCINNIITADKTYYNTELFLKDCYESLLKKAVAGTNNAIAPAFQATFPANMLMNSSLHDKSDPLFPVTFPIYPRTVTLADPSSFHPFKINFLKTKNITSRTNPVDLRKVYVIGSIEDLHTHDFYDNYDFNWRGAKVQRAYTSIYFQNFIIEEYGIPCIVLYNGLINETISKKISIDFKRVDNPNILLGNVLGGSPVFRQPYTFSQTLKPYMYFFVDIGSTMFITPPFGRTDIVDNKFGFGGLYALNTAQFKYVFPHKKSGDPVLANYASSYDVSGRMISYGDNWSTPQTPGGTASRPCPP